MSKEIKVGDEFYFVYSDDRDKYKNHHTKVTKVGRKWVETDDGHRFDINDWRYWADGKGYTSPGRLWESQQAYEDHIEILKLARKIQYRCGLSSIDDIPLQNMRQAAELLGIDSKWLTLNNHLV